MKRNLVLLITIITVSAHAQDIVTDNDIVKAILGQNVHSVSPTLDKLGVWYYMHFKPDRLNSDRDAVKAVPKVYSISNGAGYTKVYILRYNKEDMIVNEIEINFRHDDKEQVLSMKSMMAATEFHVGTYSTDIVYRLKP